MKKMMTALVALFAFVASANAMSYEQARQQALFLTDKMAYELNLTEEQYEAAYEVNLDYLMGVNTQDDLYGVYWERRNLDLSYILLDWQYRMYLDATYFYRPLYWSGGYWHFGIYARYPHRSYFYFGMPRFYSVYRGGHAWHMNGGRSWYHGRSFAPAGRSRNEHFGMHNRYQRGDYGRGQSFQDRGRNGGNVGGRNGNMGGRNGGNVGGRTENMGGRNGNVGGRSENVGSRNGGNFGGRRSDVGGSRPSSTRTTVGSESRPSVNHQPSTGRSSESGVPRNTFTPSRSSGSSVGSSSHNSGPTRSFGGSHSGSSTRSSSVGSSGGSRSSGSMSGGSHGGGSRSGGGGGHFGGRR
ncbi:MAG: hypothetical protein IKW78_01535 [Prevotella sp.]|nr:hypothetical protein [Prevotella sp.]